jgi:hypothetical protein
MTSEGAQRSYIFTDVRGHPTAPAFPHIDIYTRLVSTATQLLRCRSRAPEQLLETYAPRLMLDEGIVDLGSNWSCYRELHGKRMETHFDIREDLFHGSGNCQCALRNHVPRVITLDSPRSTPQLRATTELQAPPLIPSSRTPSSPRVSSVLDNRVCRGR